MRLLRTYSIATKRSCRWRSSRTLCAKRAAFQIIGQVTQLPCKIDRRVRADLADEGMSALRRLSCHVRLRCARCSFVRRSGMLRDHAAAWVAVGSMFATCATLPMPRGTKMMVALPEDDAVTTMSF